MNRGGGPGKYDRGRFYATKNNRRRPFDEDFLDDDDDVDRKNVK